MCEHMPRNFTAHRPVESSFGVLSCPTRQRGTPLHGAAAGHRDAACYKLGTDPLQAARCPRCGIVVWAFPLVRVPGTLRACPRCWGCERGEPPSSKSTKLETISPRRARREVGAHSQLHCTPPHEVFVRIYVLPYPLSRPSCSAPHPAGRALSSLGVGGTLCVGPLVSLAGMAAIHWSPATATIAGGPGAGGGGAGSERASWCLGLTNVTYSSNTGSGADWPCAR